MLRSMKKLSGYHVAATDGPVGHVQDFYFDDRLWKVRYLVVDTDTWLPNRRVLLAPIALGRPAWERREFPVLLTRDQVKNSPESGAHPPVSLQHQLALHRYYAWPLYWGSYDLAGPAGMGLPSIPSQPPSENPPADEGDPHLQSVKEVSGYHVEARDGGIGHVDDFIVDDQNWEFRYVVVETRNWLPGGKRVLLSPEWIERVEWPDEKIYVELTREGVRHSPEFRPEELIDREYERELYRHHGRQPYWEERAEPPQPAAATPAARPASKQISESQTATEIPSTERPGGGGDMLHPITLILGRELQARDGPAGKIEDLYFDERGWKIRYLLANAGNWANNRRFLVSAAVIGPGSWDRENRTVSVPLTRDELRGSPDFGNDMPRRGQERELHQYYGWPYYWAEETGFMGGRLPLPASAGAFPAATPERPAATSARGSDTPKGESDLRSIRNAMGFHLQASDGAIGHIDNFIFADDWTVRYAQIDTSNLPGGKSVLLASEWIRRIDWKDKKVFVDIDRKTIRNSPEYHPDKLNRDFESRLYEYHRRPGYWRAA